MDTNISNYNCDSYCGLYCGACDVMHACKTGEKDRFAAFWTESRLRSINEAQGITIEEDDLQLKCHGCKSDTVFINCRACEIKKCARSRSVEHCSECSEYPCKIFLGMKDGEKVLPHIKSKQGNLEAIKESGIDRWLIEQEDKWKCPECQTPFAWYSTHCSNCGRNLKKYTYRFSWLNAFFLDLGFRSVSKNQNRQE